MVRAGGGWESSPTIGLDFFLASSATRWLQIARRATLKSPDRVGNIADEATEMPFPLLSDEDLTGIAGADDFARSSANDQRGDPVLQ